VHTHIKILGWIHTVLGGLGLTIGLALLAVTIAGGAGSRTALAFFIPIFLILALLYLIPAFVGGIGLLRSKSWARILILIYSAFLLLAFPIGTPLGIYGLWTLLRRDAQLASPTPASPQVSHARPPQRYAGLVLAMVSVAAAFTLVLGFGYFMSRQQRAAWMSNDLFGVVAGLTLVVLAFGIAWLLGVFRIRFRIPSEASRQYRKDAARAQALSLEQRRRRVAELSADPARQKYAPLVERGEQWSDEQIAYHENPSLTVTCAHLQPIEQAMRAAGIDMRRSLEAPQVSAQCRINRAELARRFPRVPSVHYSEFYQGERPAYDFPIAVLACDECRSSIYVLHPAEAKPQTPWFPAPP